MVDERVPVCAWTVKTKEVDSDGAEVPLSEFQSTLRENVASVAIYLGHMFETALPRVVQQRRLPPHFPDCSSFF